MHEECDEDIQSAAEQAQCEEEGEGDRSGGGRVIEVWWGG